MHCLYFKHLQYFLLTLSLSSLPWLCFVSSEPACAALASRALCDLADPGYTVLLLTPNPSVNVQIPGHVKSMPLSTVKAFASRTQISLL